MFRVISRASAALFLMTAAPMAGAAVVEIDTVSGVFGNANTVHAAAAGLGTSSINWGRANRNSPFNSAYTFRGGAVSTNAPSFVLGTFEHRNGTIARRTGHLLGVDLAIDVAGRLAGQAFSFSRLVSVLHDETNNDRAPCGRGGGSPCGDTVNFAGFNPFELEVDAGRFIYTLAVEAFFDAPNGGRVGDFFTAELDTNQAYIIGRVTAETDTGQEPEEPPEPPEPPAPVPLPAAGLLLLGALGLLGAARRR